MSSDQYVARMSELLLQRWAMLAETCPTCYLPLMKAPASPEDNEQPRVVCVRCSQTTPTQVPNTSSTPQQGGNQSRVAASVPTYRMNGIAYPQSERQNRPPTPPTPEISHLPPPAVPTTQSQPQYQQQQQPQPQQQREPVHRTGSFGDEPIDESAYMRTVEAHSAVENTASSAIGEKLLMGWTMLQDCCNVCHAPLMSAPASAHKVCVVCAQNAPSSRAGGTNSNAPTREMPSTSRAAAYAPVPIIHDARPRTAEHPLPTTMDPIASELLIPVNRLLDTMGSVVMDAVYETTAGRMQVALSHVELLMQLMSSITDLLGCIHALSFIQECSRDHCSSLCSEYSAIAHKCHHVQLSILTALDRITVFIQTMCKEREDHTTEIFADVALFMAQDKKNRTQLASQAIKVCKEIMVELDKLQRRAQGMCMK